MLPSVGVVGSPPPPSNEWEGLEEAVEEEGAVVVVHLVAVVHLVVVIPLAVALAVVVIVTGTHRVLSAHPATVAPLVHLVVVYQVAHMVQVHQVRVVYLVVEQVVEQVVRALRALDPQAERPPPLPVDMGTHTLVGINSSHRGLQCPDHAEQAEGLK